MNEKEGQCFSCKNGELLHSKKKNKDIVVCHAKSLIMAYPHDVFKCISYKEEEVNNV